MSRVGCTYGDDQSYNWGTAVNEWVFQIWLLAVAGHESVLSPPQREALAIMRATPHFPFMPLNRPYPHMDKLVVHVR